MNSGDQLLTEAVNTLKGISTNDDVGQAGTVRKDEDSAVTTSVIVAVAWVTAVEFLIAKILASSNDAGFRKRYDVTNPSRDVECLRGGNAGNECRELNVKEFHGYAIK